jgi:hypothetical protein
MHGSIGTALLYILYLTFVLTISSLKQPDMQKQHVAVSSADMKTIWQSMKPAYFERTTGLIFILKFSFDLYIVQYMML